MNIQKHTEQDYQDQPDGVLQQQLHDLASRASGEIRLKGIVMTHVLSQIVERPIDFDICQECGFNSQAALSLAALCVVAPVRGDHRHWLLR